MEPFDVLSMGNISDFYLEPSKPLNLNPGFKPVVLNTMNPIIRRIFFGLIKGFWYLKN